MTVKLSLRRQEKILGFLADKEWITTRTKATLRELAQVIGIVQSAAEFYPWAIAQLQILQQLARDTITATYYVVKRMHKERHEYVEHVKQQLPNYLSYCL